MTGLVQTKMVFPSLGCETCKKRRVKVSGPATEWSYIKTSTELKAQCDTKRPVCERCRKGGRCCDWDSHAAASLPFRDENAFAGGQARRPRKRTHFDAHGDISRLSSACFTISRPLNESLDRQALSFFAHNFIASSNQVPDFGHDHLTYLSAQWDVIQDSSITRPALVALSIAFFGQARREGSVMQKAETHYTDSLRVTRRAIGAANGVGIGQILLAALMMSSYESIVYETNGRAQDSRAQLQLRRQGVRTWNPEGHYNGILGLLQLHQESETGESTALRRAVRRPVVSALQHGTLEHVRTNIDDCGRSEDTFCRAR